MCLSPKGATIFVFVGGRKNKVGVGREDNVRVFNFFF